MRIMFVDDDPSVLGVYRTWAEGRFSGMNVYSSGSQTLAKAQELNSRGEQADLVILGFHLDESRGNDLARALRRLWPSALLVLNASGSMPSVERSLFDYITRTKLCQREMGDLVAWANLKLRLGLTGSRD